MSIQVSGLTKVYGEQTAVDAISLNINKGEIVGFLGPNGAGKSTTMKMLTCYIPPTSGTASVGGFDILKDALKVRSKVGYLPESNPLYFDMYVREYLDFIGGINGIKNRKSKINDLIEQTGLQKESNKLIGQLSKGYKQRVGLAQALMNDPEVLILDEPTSGLDPNQLVEIRKLIKTIGQEKTVMLSTHIMQEVEQMCDRVLIINNGKIVADEKVEALAENSQGQFLVEVIFTKPIAVTELVNEAVTIFEQRSDRHFIVSARKRIDITNGIFRVSVTNENSVIEIKDLKRDLETVFRDITKN
ncbi:MAG: ATP-binding cassette domain-containing protein [Bacteroidetes bacterium]|nr:ATP-binding cassette domain-containing protein [Bacteroidota bacterium]